MCTPMGLDISKFSAFENSYNIKEKYNCTWESGCNIDRTIPPLPGWKAMPAECVKTYHKLKSLPDHTLE